MRPPSSRAARTSSHSACSWAAVPGREQLLVEGEERHQPHQGGAPRARRGAAPPRCRRAPAHRRPTRCRRRRRHTATRGTNAGDVVADRVHAGAHGAEPRRPTLHAHRRTGRSATWALEHVVGLTHRGAAHRTAGETSRTRGTRGVGPDPCGSPRRAHGHRRRVPGGSRARASCAQMPGARRLVAQVDDVERGPAGPQHRGPAAHHESRRRVASASGLGTGLTRVTAAPARRARSMATSRAFQVGARSSW